MNSNFFKLIEKIGNSFFWSQSSGGNISWKDGNTLWVKASGTSLRDVNEKEIFVPVDLSHLSKQIQSENFHVTPILVSKTHLRPSIETYLHAIISSKIVFHLHPIKLLGYLVRLNGEDEVHNIYRGRLSVGVLDYCLPGPLLAKKLFLFLKEANLPDLILLKNHGIIIHGNSKEEVQYNLEVIDNLLPNYIFHSPLNEQISQVDIPNLINKNGLSYQKIDNEFVQNLALNMELFEIVKDKWALYPDHVVYLGAKPNCYESVNDFMLSNDFLNSQIIFIKCVGVFSGEKVDENVLQMLICYYEVIIRQEKKDLLVTLDDNDVSDLINWDAEKYRRTLKY